MPGDRTQVGIIGAGPAGLLLSHLLHMQGIESVLIERHGRPYVESRIRAGLLEWGTVELLKRTGRGMRLMKEGVKPDGFTLVLDCQPHRFDLADLTQDKSATAYGQSALIKDIIRARIESGELIHLEGQHCTIENIEGDRPVIRHIQMAIVAKMAKTCLKNVWKQQQSFLASDSNAASLQRPLSI